MLADQSEVVGSTKEGGRSLWGEEAARAQSDVSGTCLLSEMSTIAVQGH